MRGEESAGEEANEGQRDHRAHEDGKHKPARRAITAAAKLAHVQRKICGRLEINFRGPRPRRNKINYFARHANDANAGKTPGLNRKSERRA